MSTTHLFPLMTEPGIKRDGTPYSGNFYIDGQWVRWQRDLPRKIGGYKAIDTTLPNILRGIYVEPVNTNLFVYYGDYQSVNYLQLDQFGNPLGATVNITPAGFVSNPNIQWKFDTMFVSTNTSANLFAIPVQTLNDLDSTVNAPVYYGPVSSALPLIPTGLTASGGIVALAPYLVYYGNDGIITVTNANDPTTIMNTARVTGQKIVQGKQIRGGNSSPAGLFWSLDSVIRMTQAGSNSTIDFRFDTLTDESSILSANSVIEYDSRYFWIGVDKFYVYNGTVQELPNEMNSNFFFDNLNYQYRNKVWATKVPRYGEIWFHFPYGNSTECNEAIIYNVKYGTWYDTSINRSCGYYAQVLPFPLWADNIANIANEYTIWQHETGYDQVINNVSTAIDSYFQTGDISWCAVAPDGKINGTDRWVNFVSFEPDFTTFVGTLNLTITTQQYAQDTAPITYGPYALTSTTNKEDLGGGGVQGRFMTLKFESNTVGGNYQMGQCLLDMGVGDARK